MSEAKRHRKRIKMVLPIRVWGTDATGKPFVCLAHTLDVTPKGARIGSFTASVKPGERIGITRGMKKAHFRVAWVGEPSTPTEEQLGVELLDADRDIWGLQLPSAEPDEFTIREARTVPPATPMAGPAPAQAPVRAASSTASSHELSEQAAEISPEFLELLRNFAAQIQRANDLTPATLHPAVLEEFQSASRQMRNASHVVERLVSKAPTADDLSSLLVLLNTFRVQTACTLCNVLANDLRTVRSFIPKHLLEELVQSVGNLFAQAANFEVIDVSKDSPGSDDEYAESPWDNADTLQESTMDMDQEIAVVGQTAHPA